MVRLTLITKKSVLVRVNEAVVAEKLIWVTVALVTPSATLMGTVTERVSVAVGRRVTNGLMRVKVLPRKEELSPTVPTGSEEPNVALSSWVLVKPSTDSKAVGVKVSVDSKDSKLKMVSVEVVVVRPTREKETVVVVVVAVEVSVALVIDVVVVLMVVYWKMFVTVRVIMLVLVVVSSMYVTIVDVVVTVSRCTRMHTLVVVTRSKRVVV